MTGTSANCSLEGVIGGNHFKTKFCANCQVRIKFPASRARALTPDLQDALSLGTMKQCTGFWKQSPHPNFDVRVRIINHNASCSGAWLAIFDGTPPDFDWPELPKEWVFEDHLILRVARGTLVPTVHSIPNVHKHAESMCQGLAVNVPGDLSSSPGAALGHNANSTCTLPAFSPGSPGGYFNSRSSDTASNGVVHHARARPVKAARRIAAEGSGVGDCAQPERTAFMHSFINAQLEIAALVEERLASPETMPEDERAHFSGQLALSNAVLQMDNMGLLSQWK